MVFHMMDSAMPLLALGELEELVSDTQRGGGVEFARLALEHLRFAEEFVEPLKLDQCAHACVQRRSSTLEAADNG